MYNLIKNIINYTGSMTGNTYDQYIIYVSAALVVILTVIFVDLIFKIFRSFLPHRDR